MDKEVTAIIDSLVKDENIPFVQVRISADGSWPDPELGDYSNWVDYIHVKGGHGKYRPDTDNLELYIKERLYGCEDVTILAVEYKTSKGEEISIPKEC